MTPLRTGICGFTLGLALAATPVLAQVETKQYEDGAVYEGTF